VRRGSPAVSFPLSLALSREGRGNIVAPKRCFIGSIDGACLETGIYSEFASEKGSLFGLMPEEGAT